MVKLKTGTAINPYAFAASKAASGLIAAATGDLAVIRTQTRPRGRSAPIQYELHLNPAAMGIAFVGFGLGLWLMQLRLHPSIVTDQVKVVDVPGVPAWTEETHMWVMEFVSSIPIPQGIPPPDLPGSHAGVGDGGITPI